MKRIPIQLENKLICLNCGMSKFHFDIEDGYICDICGCIGTASLPNEKL